MNVKDFYLLLYSISLKDLSLSPHQFVFVFETIVDILVLSFVCVCTFLLCVIILYFSHFWDYAQTIFLDEIVYIHCHQQRKYTQLLIFTTSVRSSFSALLLYGITAWHAYNQFLTHCVLEYMKRMEYKDICNGYTLNTFEDKVIDVIKLTLSSRNLDISLKH